MVTKTAVARALLDRHGRTFSDELSHADNFLAAGVGMTCGLNRYVLGGARRCWLLSFCA